MLLHSSKVHKTKYKLCSTIYLSFFVVLKKVFLERCTQTHTLTFFHRKKVGCAFLHFALYMFPTNHQPATFYETCIVHFTERNFSSKMGRAAKDLHFIMS